MPESLIPENRPQRQRAMIPDAPRGRRSIIISPEDEKRLDEMSYSSAPAKAAPVKQEKPLGLMGTIREGAKSTLRTLGATVDTAQGDAAGVVTAAQEQAAAPKDPDLEKFYAHIDEQKKALGENPSLFEGIKAVGSAAINNPRGFGLMIAEQLPNSAAALGAGAAGALAGSLAGPVGTVAGGLAGLAGANIGLETGSKALEAAQDSQFTPEEQSRVKKEGLIKGGTITGVDALTLGATKFITGTTRRAVERATTKTLADNGVDVTNAAARKAALETPEIADAVKNAQELAKKGSEKLGQTLARTGGAVALETIGEGAGEYLGELAATGKANAVDAVVEGFAGLGTSIGEITATSALNRKGLQRLFDSPETAEKTAEEETKNTGVPHEVIQHPTEPDKFVAVPKVRSVGGIELQRDVDGNLKPVQPTSTQTDFNIANKPGFDLTAEDKIREQALNKAREDQYAKNPIIVPGVTPTPNTNAKTIAGKPVSDLSKDALIYTVSRGSARAKQIATDELDRRNANTSPATPAAPETPTDAVKRIVATGAEKAKEDGKKAGAIVTPAKVAKPATAPKTAKPVTPKVAKPAAAPKPAPIPKPEEVKNENVSKTTEAAPQPVKPEPQPLKPENAAIPEVDRSSGDTTNTKNVQEQGAVAPPLKPKRKSTSARNKEAFAKLADHFTPGNIVKGYGGYDRVISFNKRENDWDVTVQGVKKDEKGDWVPNGHVRTHATFPDARNTIVERAPLKPEAKPEPKAAPVTEPKPTEEPAKAEAHPLRAHIESLIKRRAAAKQSGKDRTINSAIDRAKEVMNGTRTDAAREANWFKGHAAVVRKNDPATADILSNISETIKPKTEKVKANEKTEKPKTANEPLRGNKVAVPRGGRILANGIAETIQTQGVAALVGQKITSPERLAELAQVYRNPRYETFRIFFTKGNAIVHASGVTARLPGSTPLFPKNFTDAQAIGWMKEMMQSSGADGYWMLHNHPSGDPKPSDADLRVTGTLAKMLPGFKGHVIINSNKYGQITIPRTNPKAEVVIKQFGEDMLLKASKPSPYLGKIIQDPGALSIVGKSFQKEGWVTLIGVSGTSGVRAVAEIPAKTFANPGLARAAIRRFGRTTGAESIFAYGSSADLKTNSARLVRDGFLRSAMDDSGTNYGVNNSGTKFGQTPGMGGQELNQNAAPFRDRMDKIADTLIYNFQDRFKPLKDIQKRAGPVPESEDASLAEERYSGTVRARTDTFEQQLRDPLLKAIHDSGVSFEGVEQYLHALHAPSRNAAMREINPTEPELKAQTDALEKQRDSLAKDPDVLKYIKTRRELRQAEADIDDGIADESLGRVLKNELAQLQRLQNVKDYSKSLDKLKALRLVKPFKGDNTALSGMSDAESKAILAKIDANGTRKALDKISAIVDTITSKTRQIYVDSGLEKADAIEAWDKKYEHYIPLHRDEVSGNTMPKVGQGFNIRGKESKRATGSNKDVTNILAHVVAQHEAAIIRSEKARVDRTLFQFAKTHPDPSLWTLDSAPMLRTVDPVSGFVVERVDPTYKNRPEVLTLKIDGEEHTITFNDQNQEAMRLAASMKNMSSEQLGEVTQMVGKLTRFLATMNTTMNPVFTARNFLRDLQTTFVNLSDTEIADKKREVFRDVPAAIKGMWALSRGKPNSQWAKYAQEFKSAGGQTGWMDHYKDIGERADTLKKELEIMKPGKMNATRRTLKAWFDIIQDANNAVENGARLSAFVHARKSGLSEGKAAQIAKNLTVNFNAHGAKGVELNAWYMFMNASIQGTARLAKAMTNRQVRKIVAGVVLSGFLMDILARSMAGDDDEDGENDYDQLPEHVKAMNFVLMVANRPVTIPMPYGYNFFASTGRKISEIMFRENYSAAKSAVDLAGIFMDAFSPTGQAGSGLQYLSPTVTDPFVQYAENKNFAGNPIRKPQNPFGVPNPEYQMGFKSTSAPGKWLAEALNNVTGGNEVRPGFVNVNPAFFDFAVSSIAGGAGRTYLQFASAPLKLANDDEVQAREIPFANIFVGARPEHQTEKKYFEAVKSVELAAEELKTYRAKGDTEMVQEIIHDHRAEIRMTEAAKETKRVLARLRKSDLALDKEDAPNKSELRKALEERKKEAMSRFNKKYREAVAAE